MTPFVLPLVPIDVGALPVSLRRSTSRVLPLVPIDVSALAVSLRRSTIRVLPLVQIDVLSGDVVWAHKTRPRATRAGEPTEWEIIAVDMTGKQYAAFPTGIVGSVSEDLDQPRLATFSIPIDAPRIAELPVPQRDTTPTREVQIYRNGNLEFWGVPTGRRADSNARVYNYEAADPLWYSTVRYMGQATRHNYLLNGSFQDGAGFLHWNDFGPTIAATIDTGVKLLDTQSAKLIATTSDDNYIAQRVVIPGGAAGRAVIITAWVRVDAMTFPAKFDRGLFVQRIAGGVPVAGVGGHGSVPIEPNVTKGQWQRMETSVVVPPLATETIEVRLYAPKGTVHWDAASLVVMESLSFVGNGGPGGAPWDQVQIAHQTWDYLAGRKPVGNPYTKSDLHVGHAGAPSGIKKERTYQFADHMRGDSALAEWTASADGFDFRIEITPTTRVFTTYYPAAGVQWNDHFEYVIDPVHPDGGHSFAVTSWDFGESIVGAASDVCEMGGWGSDAGREEGSFSDPDAFGGLTIELVESAPPEASIDLLDTVAQARGAQLSKPLPTIVLTMVEPSDPTTGEVLLPLIGVLKPGDLIPLLIIDGDVNVDALVRCTSVTINGDDTLTVAVSLPLIGGGVVIQ